jgi:hypothetical protein
VLLGILRPAPAAAQFDADTTAASADSLGQGSDTDDGDLGDLMDTPPDTTRRRRSGDSEVPDILEVLKPSYETRYNVVRQSTTWDQRFDFGSTFGFLTFNNKTNFQVSTDSGRDEDKRVGNNATTLRFTMIKKLPLTARVDLGRTSVARPGDEQKVVNSTVTANANYNLGLMGIRNSLSLGGGYTHRNDELVGREFQRNTQDTRFSGTFQWRGNWTHKTLTVGTSFKESRSTKNSVNFKPEGDVTDESTNSDRSYGINVSYSPLSWAKSTVNVSKSSASDVSFVLREDALEHTVRENQNILATLDLSPMEHLKLNWNIQATKHDLSYQVLRDRASSGNGLSWDGKLTTRILGADVTGKLSSRKDVLNPVTSADRDSRNNIFDGKISRRLSAKFEASFDWLVRATQIFYTDPDPRQVLDRDELRTKLQPSLTYTNQKWTVTTSYVRSTSRRVELNPARARQTQEDEDFSVDFSINYRLSERTNLSQTYSIQAVYTTLPFNRTSDRLLSTQRIVSTINTQITPKVRITLTHRFTLQDNGPFRFEPDGTRVFTRNLRKYRQELTTDLEYDMNSWLTFTANSRFLRTDDVIEATGFRTINRNLDLRQGAKVQHDLGLGASFTAEAQFVRGTFQDSYWNISSTLSKDF